MNLEDLSTRSQGLIFVQMCKEGKIVPEDFPKSQTAIRLLVRSLRSG